MIPAKAVFLVSLLLLSNRIVEGWTKRQREPVDRNGLDTLRRRRTKEEKKEKKVKIGKSEKKSKKYSKKAKYYYYTSGYYSSDLPIDEVFAGDLDGFYEDIFQHISAGSMSMSSVIDVSASSKMLEVERMGPNDESEYNEHTLLSSQDHVRISIAPYSIRFSFIDGVIPTRREDYNELVSVTKSLFQNFMMDYFESTTISDLIDFEVEFVKTGVFEDEIFIVFESTAIFDSKSYTIPESSRIQDTLGDALVREKKLWMEYVTALQELNPNNAFSSTFSVAYMEGFPNEKGHIQSISSPSTADTIAYSAAVGITLLSVVAFLKKRKRDEIAFNDFNAYEKKTTFRSDDSCASTIAETLTCVSSSFDAEDRLVRNVINERKLKEGTKKQQILERLPLKDGVSRLAEEKHESQTNLKEELEIIIAEAAARTADELRLKEKRKLEFDRESPDLQSRLNEYTRRAEELKLQKFST